MGGMEQRLAGKIDALESSVKTNERHIQVLTSSVNCHSEELASLARRLDRTEQRLEQPRRTTWGNPDLADSITSLDQGHQVVTGRTSEQVSRYWRCRRSLRLWPLSGPDLVRDAERFLVDFLGFAPDFARDLGVLPVRRVVEPRSKIENEAIVEFPTPAIRDAVKGSGFKLQGRRARMRIELPHFLKADFNVLQSLSYRLKMANTEMKRSVKFDDAELGLYLDLQLPGEEWRRIRPAQARQARDNNPVLRDGPRELSPAMISTALGNSAGPPSGPGTSSVNENGRPPLTGANTTPLP